MNLLPDNTIVGSTDEVPGVHNTKMPQTLKWDSFKPVDVQTIYSHNVRITSMNDVEAAFGAFIKDWRSFPEAGTESTVDSKPQIIERRLSVTPHNSWRVLNGGSFVSLNREDGGTFHSSGALKILNYPLHPLVALVFKLEYRGN